mmetsp:Transcript_17946/g.36820  ORF Transcript_17946/g.36820 Transcript_17946/m.36820 type:complete len:249 (+) Transcript_17946:127-873(+)
MAFVLFILGECIVFHVCERILPVFVIVFCDVVIFRIFFEIIGVRATVISIFFEIIVIVLVFMFPIVVVVVIGLAYFILAFFLVWNFFDKRLLYKLQIRTILVANAVFPHFREDFIRYHHRVTEGPFLMNVSGVRQIFEEEGVPWNPPDHIGVFARVLPHAILVVVFPIDDPNQIEIILVATGTVITLPEFSYDSAHRRLVFLFLHVDAVFCKVPAPAVHLHAVRSVVAVVLGPGFTRAVFNDKVVQFV